MSKDKILFFIIAMLAGCLCLFFIWRPNGILDLSNPDDIANVAVEFHGMIFDIILFGIILTLYEYFSDQKQRISRYKEEIDDFRGWDEKEAAYRIRGNIKRLNKEGVNKIDLFYCFLNGTDLKEVNLREANLRKSNLSKADLRGADLREANMRDANIKGANASTIKPFGGKLYGINFKKLNLIGNHLRTDFRGTDLNGANLFEANLVDADLRGANLTGANLSCANLIGTNLGDANLYDANFSETDLSQTIGLTFEQLTVVKSLWNAKGIDKWEDKLREKRPSIFTFAGPADGSNIEFW